MIPLEHDSLELALSARLDAGRRAWYDDAIARVRATPEMIATVFPAALQPRPLDAQKMGDESGKSPRK